MSATGRKSNTASTASGKKPVTARCTGWKIHHQDIQIRSPMLPRIGYGIDGSGNATSSRKIAGPAAACSS